MSDLVINRKTLPDWSNCRAIALVYPYKIREREHLVPFYDKLLTYIPPEIEIILLVKNLSSSKKIEQKCSSMGITNKIEIVECPGIFDIWIRDYAPLTVTEGGIHLPVKFQYAPSYVENEFEKYIQCDNKVGESLGEKFISKDMRSVDLIWDMGNLTHNGVQSRFVENLICNIT